MNLSSFGSRIALPGIILALLGVCRWTALPAVNADSSQPPQVEFTDIASATGGHNMLRNGSFDVGTSGWSSLGIPAGWGNLAHLHGSVISSSEPDHRWFLRIPLGGGRTPTLCFDYDKPSTTPQTSCLAAGRGWIRVEPGATYTVSCDMRSSAPDTPAALGVVCRNPEDPDWQQKSLTHAVTIGTSWRRYAYAFQANSRYVFVAVGPTLAEDRRVDVDIDNVQLEKGDRPTPFEPGSLIEAALEPSAAAGIFAVGEPAVLTLRVRSYLSSRVPLRVELTANDYFGTSVLVDPVSVAAEPDTVTEKKISLPATWRGFYRISARITGNAPVTVVNPSLSLAFVPKPKADTFLGINHAFPDAFLIQLASRAGVSWYRDWSLKWDDIEPSPGSWDWSVGDTQINRVLKEGARLMALLPPFPSAEWSSEAPEAPGANAHPGNRLRQSAAPKDSTHLEDFVRRAVARYKDRIRFWEFLNEPIYTDYSLPQRAMNGYDGPTYSTTDYVRLLKPAADAMRRSDPKCKVIGGVAAGPGYLTAELMDAGILQVVDILNLHIYPGAQAPEAYIPEMDRLLKDMDDHGGRRPIWITEFSYYGADDLPKAPWVSGNGEWAGERLLRDERQCADYTVRFLLVMLSHGVEKVFLHSGACGSVNSPSLECCLFDYGGAPRRIVPALATLADVLGAKPRCLKTTGNGSLHTASFENGGRIVTAVWSTGDAPTQIAVPRGAKCMNVVGQEIKGRATITGSPVYLIGPTSMRESLTNLSITSSPPE